MVSNRCDPQPPITVEKVTVDGASITLVHVDARTPGVVYTLDKTKVYVRAGATDRLAHGGELAALYSRPPVESSTFPWRPVRP